MQVVVAFAAGCAIAPVSNTRTLFEGLNQSSLPTFVAANLLTGLVNISIDTLAVSDWAARAVVAIYALMLCIPALFWQDSLTDKRC